MNRFREKGKQNIPVDGLFLSVVLTVGCFGLFMGGIFSTERDVASKEREQLEQVLNQSAAICYSLEGAYPESLSYLKEHYGISWNEDRYLVDFEAVGTNLPPDIVVIPRNRE